MPYQKTINFSADATTSTLTTNQNYLTPISFKLTMDNQKFPNAEFTVQMLFIPDLNVTPARFATPQRNIPVDGDKIEYAPVTMTFLIDEELNNYREMHDWMLGEVTVADDIKQYRKERDITIHILSSHNNVTKQIQFVDAFPTNLSALPFDVTVTDLQYLTAQVTFDYSYYKIL